MKRYDLPDDCNQPNAVHALLRKRSELIGQLEFVREQSRQIAREIDHLDTTIRLFDEKVPLDAAGSKPVPPRLVASKGEVQQIVLRYLRTASEPKKTTDLTEQVMKERGMDLSDHDLRRTMVKRTGACLRNLREKGIVESLPTSEQVSSWRVIRTAQTPIRR